MSVIQGDPYWEASPDGGWELTVPILIETAQGMCQVGTNNICYPFIYNATLCYEDGTKSKRFRSTEEAKAFALATYLLESGKEE